VWLVVAIAGCGRISFDPSSDAPSDGSVCTFGAWSTPVELAEVSSPQDDWEPTLSSDGQRLVFSSNRDGALHLYMATKLGTGAFSAPAPIDPLTTTMTEYGPAWFGNDRLYFDRGTTTIQLHTSEYSGTAFSPASPITELVGETVEAPAISSDELEMFYSTNFELRRATRPTSSDTWTLAGAVTELRSGAGEAYPTLSRDGLVIYFESDRVNAMGDIYVASRPSIGAPFANAAPVTELNGSGANIGTSDADLSPDGRTMVFASRRPGGTGSWDIYVSERDCQ